jgi:hypothetical protein
MSTHKCGACHLLFRYQTELDAHIREEHLKERPRWRTTDRDRRHTPPVPAHHAR